MCSEPLLFEVSRAAIKIQLQTIGDGLEVVGAVYAPKIDPFETCMKEEVSEQIQGRRKDDSCPEQVVVAPATLEHSGAG